MENGRKEIRRATDCPAEKCSAMQQAAHDIDGVAKQVKNMGATFLVVLGIIATILIFLTKGAMSSAETTKVETRTFIQTHTTAMITNATLESKMLEQIKQLQEQNKKIVSVQEGLIKKMTRYEMLEEVFLGKEKH